MTFYLKYRPKNLDELDLKDVATTLEKIIKSGSIPHAFLFIGPKGTGKTSSARILSKIINCESKNPPCDKCDQCLSISNGNNLDVIEMDAASNRGIDDIRNLRDFVKLSPNKAKKKIYIIDEVHMLTTEASNALLKTLEEPPEHIIFILATTNPEKLIDTIISRCTVINFRKASVEEISHSLKRVVDAENIKITDGDLNFIAKKAGGAFRDAVKMLEQFSVEGADSLLNKSMDEKEFFEFLLNKDRQSCIAHIKNLVVNGRDVNDLYKSTLEFVQSEIEKGNDQVIDLGDLLIIAGPQMKESPIEELPFEIAIVKWCGELESGLKNQNIIATSESVVENVIKTQSSNWNNDEMWQKILSSIKPINASLEALLRSSKPLSFDGKTLNLGVYYKFHKERLEESSHRKIVEEIVSKVFNNEIILSCTLVEAPIIAPLTEDRDKDIIKVAEEIFS